MTHPVGSRARRADAQHNIKKILDAAVDCLSRNSDASMSEIARVAGLGRVTLYGHFPTRDSLVEAALTRVLSAGDEVLGGLDLTGDPRAALRKLITSSWLLIAQSSAILETAQGTLTPGRLQDLHASHTRRVDGLIRRGQVEGVFRTDLPVTWLASVMHHALKGAVADVHAGRLERMDAPGFLAETILGAFRPSDL